MKYKVNALFQVTRVFCYLTVVTLQYLVPVFLILFSTLSLKALGKLNTHTTIITTTTLREESTLDLHLFGKF